MTSSQWGDKSSSQNNKYFEHYNAKSIILHTLSFYILPPPPNKNININSTPHFKCLKKKDLKKLI
jgi:hypothetical protein